MTTVRYPVLNRRNLGAATLQLREQCKVMAKLVDTHGKCTLANQSFEPFQTLATAIIGQQLSLKAADTIKSRVLLLAPNFTAEEMLATKIEDLRSAGLSGSKSKYLFGLATAVAEDQLNFSAMKKYSDEDVIQQLTALNGIGRWTAEMFLIFGLKRPNVLSLGDAGLQRAVRLVFGEKATLEKASKKWKPYCSLASWYLWKQLDG